MNLREEVRRARAKAVTPAEMRVMERWIEVEQKRIAGTATPRELRTEKALRRRVKAIEARIEQGLPNPIPQA